MWSAAPLVSLLVYLGFFVTQASKVTLRDVGKVIKSLVGDFYHPLYLSKEFQQKLAPEKTDIAGEYNFNDLIK